jgi:hypothetical protein
MTAHPATVPPFGPRSVAVGIMADAYEDHCFAIVGVTAMNICESAPLVMPASKAEISTLGSPDALIGDEAATKSPKNWASVAFTTALVNSR